MTTYNSDEIFNFWHIDDIKKVNESLTEEEVQKVKRALERYFDASTGMDWEDIENAVERVIWERSRW